MRGFFSRISCAALTPTRGPAVRNRPLAQLGRLRPRESGASHVVTSAEIRRSGFATLSVPGGSGRADNHMRRQLSAIYWVLALAPTAIVGAMWARSNLVCDTLTLVERGMVTGSIDRGGFPVENQWSIDSSDDRVCVAIRRFGRGLPPPPPPFPRYSPDGTPWDGEWTPLPLMSRSFAFVRTALSGGKLPPIADYDRDYWRMGVVSLSSENYHTTGVLFSYWQVAAVAAIPAAALLGIKAFANRKSVRRARRGLCVRCGYNLVASPGRCPECGAEPRSKAVKTRVERQGL